MTDKTNATLDDTQKICAHCESVLGRNAIHEKESALCFCCDGCRTVFYLINSEGYSSYYDKRTGVKAGQPAEKAEVSAECFEEYVKLLPNGAHELTVVISGIRCASCIWLIENFLVKTGHISSIRMNYANHKAKIVYDPNLTSLEDVLNSFTKLGYCPLPSTEAVTESDKERKDYFYRFAVGAFFSMQLMIYSAALYAGYFQGISENFRNLFQYISWGLATPVIIYSAYPFFKKAFIALKHKHFTMDTLAALGSGSAYLYSIAAIFLGRETYFDTSSGIITLILLGRFIEAGAKQRGGNAVGKLLSLKPKKVRKMMDSGESVIIPAEQLCVGDIFEVSAGSNVAADGRITLGMAELDESMLTGESKPAEKGVGAQIFTGTKIISGTVIVRTEHVALDTFISKVAAAVENAQGSKAPIQDVADRFIGYFVPFVIIVAMCTFVGWFIVGGQDIAEALMRAVSVLVIACPCAMGLATPLAVILSAAKLTEKGIVFKSGEAIERFARTDDFYFDKTGTITKGEMSVQAHESFDDGATLETICKAAAFSKHPASIAISMLKEQGSMVQGSYEDIAGKGIIVKVDNEEVLIGSERLLIENGILINSSVKNLERHFINEGLTIVYAAVNGKLTAIFGTADSIRPEAKETIDMLKARHYNVTVLTGDNVAAAEKLFFSSGIDVKLYAGISPFEKAEIISSAPNISRTVMAGDGINDAVALTAAASGISMRSGTDISLESASAVLLRNDLRLIPAAHLICHKTLRLIKQNLFWAFSYNIAAIPLAVAGLIHPIMSAAFMGISSLLVITNSSRIKRF